MIIMIRRITILCGVILCTLGCTQSPSALRPSVQTINTSIGNTSPNSPLIGGAVIDPTITVYANIAKTDNLVDFSNLLHTSGLDQTLSGPGPFTIFAPLDPPLRALPNNEFANFDIPSNRAMLINFLSTYIVPGTYTLDKLSNGTSITSVNGVILHVVHTNGILTLNSVPIEETQGISSNGIFYVADQVIPGK